MSAGSRGHEQTDSRKRLKESGGKGSSAPGGGETVTRCGATVAG